MTGLNFSPTPSQPFQPTVIGEALLSKIACDGSCPVFAVEGAKIPTFRPATVTRSGLFSIGTLVLGMIFSENRFTLFRIMP